jgi:hypothetical protein
MQQTKSRSSSQASKLVAIAVPLSTRPGFTPEEEISLRHLLHFLGEYDKYFVAPKSLKIHHDAFQVKAFSDNFFGSVAAHSKLMLSPVFYEAFHDYKYVVNYHLDSLVFADQLEFWCQTDLDYIGPPWLPCEDSPWVRVPRVGNGGFSLRKVDSFLKVLSSTRYSVDPAKYWERFCASRPKHAQYLNIHRKYLKRLRRFNGVQWEMSRLYTGKAGGNEDHFWSDEAVKYFPDFKVASIEEGLRFAFEVAPRLCFEMNNRTLPFGCHAWYKFDRTFWEPYLLPEDKWDHHTKRMLSTDPE